MIFYTKIEKKKEKKKHKIMQMLCYYLVNPCQHIIFYKERKMGLGSSSFYNPNLTQTQTHGSGVLPKTPHG